jgi:hypothetical protein
MEGCLSQVGSRCYECDYGYNFFEWRCVPCNTKEGDWVAELKTCDVAHYVPQLDGCQCDSGMVYDGYSCKLCGNGCLKCETVDELYKCTVCNVGYAFLPYSDICSSQSVSYSGL